MLCWEKELDLNTVTEIFFGRSGTGPNMISVSEHSTSKALAVRLQVGSFSKNPHHPWAEGVRMERKMERSFQLLNTEHPHNLQATIFLFLLTSGGTHPGGIGSILPCQFGGG